MNKVDALKLLFEIMLYLSAALIIIYAVLKNE